MNEAEEGAHVEGWCGKVMVNKSSWVNSGKGMNSKDGYVGGKI